MIKQILKNIIILISLCIWHQNAYANDIEADIQTLQHYYTDKKNNHDKEISEIINSHKNDIHFDFRLGQLFLGMGKPLDAEIIFKKLYTEHPKDKYEIGYGQALLAQAKYQDILYVVKVNALSDDLKSYKHLLHAHAYLGLTDINNALNSIEQALALNPENENFLILKARILTFLKKIDESLAILDTLEEKGYDIIEVNIFRAENYIAKKDYSKAKASYNKIIAQQTDAVEAYFGRAKINLLMNNPIDALQDGLFLLKKNPKSYMGTFIIASALNAQKKYADALAIYDRQSDTINLFLPSLLLEAEINFNNKRYGRAQVLINKYLKIDPDNAKALKLRGTLKLQDGSPYDAIGDLESAYKAEKTDPYILIALSQAYYRTNRYDDAERSYKKLGIKFPAFKSITDNAFALSCKFNTVKIKQANLCRDIVQSEIAEQILNALGFLHIDDTAKAVNKIEKLIHIYPNNLLVQKYYARILNISGQADKAVNIFFEILTKEPENKEILSELYIIYKSGKSTLNIIEKMSDLFAKNQTMINIGYYLADFFYTNKNYTKSIDITKSMIKRKPHDTNLYEMILKNIINKPYEFTSDIQYYLKKYEKIGKYNPTLIRFLRQKIMLANFKKAQFTVLELPLRETTAKDYQIYAEYLNFVNNHQAADVIYKNSTKRFSDDFNLYNSAFSFYEDYKNTTFLNTLKQRFTNKNKNYQTILQAKLYLNQGNTQKATDLLQEQFQEDKHGIIADLLLKNAPTQENIDSITSDIENITEYKYDAVFTLANLLYKNLNFDDASRFLLPYYNQQKANFDYKILLSKISFYTNFSFSYEIIRELIHESPSNTELLTHYIAFETKNKNYSNAIALFKKIKPDIKEYPAIHFYYAYALLMTDEQEQAIKILNTLSANDYKFLEKKEIKTLIKKYNKTQKSGSA